MTRRAWHTLRRHHVSRYYAVRLSPDELAFLAAERAAEEQACPACGGTGVRE